ncbi:TolC family protein [Litoribacter ruber]|uniref:TolC family protein n=1 Tax=Litoribacter ruber TaxID=702568 RepID=UPI001BD99660|nr:TolC family protein [Litoribacter ruber]MBT0812130.1 TolC family protein [Litoribacter ruber]
MNKSFCLALALLIVAFPGFAQEQEREKLDFEKAIELGLDNNFQVKIAINETEIAEYDRQLGQSLLLPSLDATYTGTYRNEDTEQRFFSEPDPRIIPGAQTYNRNFTMATIYGFRPEAVVALKRLGKLAEVTDLEAKVVIENTVATIATSYYRLVLELQRYDVLSKALELSEERLDIARAQYEFGQASKRDFLAAQVDYNADLAALVNQEQIIETTRINLNEILAIDPDVQFVVNDTITIQENIRLGDLVENAYTDNKQLLATQRMENVAYLQLREARAARLPYLTITGAYNNSIMESDAGFLAENRVDGFTAGATVGINLFSGFALNRRIQQARVQQRNQQFAVEQFEIQMKSDLHRSYNIYTNTKRLLEIERENYEVAVENSEIALERFRLGIASYLEFRDAQVNRLQAESRLIEAVYNIKESEIELMRLSGKIYFQNPQETIY